MGFEHIHNKLLTVDFVSNYDLPVFGREGF